MIKVLHLNDKDIQGGAARAAYRIHQGLRSVSVDSHMMVRTRASEDDTVIPIRRRSVKWIAETPPLFDRLPLWLYRKRQRISWSVNWIPTLTPARIARIHPDLIHLHWVGNGFVSIADIGRLRYPLVWTLADMWALTGGCHYDQECGQYQKQCGACPQLCSSHEYDASRAIWLRKRWHWRHTKLTLVAPSRWLALQARASSLFRYQRIEIIPYGLNLEHYKPLPGHIARELLGLPQDRKLIVFGAMFSTVDRRKGFQYLQSALQDLAAQGWHDQAAAVIFGSSRPHNDPDLGLPSFYTGHLYDDVSLALLYAAADVVVVPSTQESFGQVASEALACGTPVVAFGATGLLDIVEHQQSGYLARPYEPDDLARGIAWVLEDDERLARLGHRCREKAEQEFGLELQARRYRALYEDILTQHRR